MINNECLSGSPFFGLVKECLEPGDEETANKRHRAVLLNNGFDALVVRLHLIRAAKKTVYLQTYLWRDDETGRLLAYELIQSAKRGVKIKLIVDSWVSGTDPSWVAFLSTAHPNLELKYYNPNAQEIHPSVLQIARELKHNFKKVNQRMHNKLFIVDEVAGITGGRNYQNDYYDYGQTRNFRDRDVLIIGKVVEDMTRSFMKYWNFDLSVYSRDLKDVREKIDNENFPVLKDVTDYQIDQKFRKIDRYIRDIPYIQSIFVKKAFVVTKVTFVADNPGKNQSFTLDGGGIVTDEFLKFKRMARKSIVIQSPYLVLGKKSIQNIKKIRKDYPNIEIFVSTNSLAATDNIYTYAYACKFLKQYVKKWRFRIFELKPFPRDYDKIVEVRSQKPVSLCIHAKTFVIDEKAVWIGSFNFDSRSFNLNTESALIIQDKEVAKTVKTDIMNDIAPQNSWTVGKREYVPWISFVSGAAHKILKYFPRRIKWPFCYTSNFELKPGRNPVPFYDDRFYDHYRSVGPYPDFNYTIKEIEVMLLKVFIDLARPIL